MKTKVFLSALIVSLAALCVLGGQHAFAATKTWTGGGTDAKMTTAGNWSGGAPSAGDDLVFPANITNRTVQNDFTAATSFNSMTFSGTATQNSDYAVSGNSMTLVAGITVSMTGAFNVSPTLSLPLILNGSQTFNAGNQFMTISGTINLGSNTLTVNTGTGLVELTGVISGTGGITKSGTGQLTLEGDNTFSGAVAHNQGDLVVEHQNGLGTSAGATTVASGASILFVQAEGDATYAEPLTLNGTGVSQYEATLNISRSFGAGGGGSSATTFATSTFTGAITLGSNVTVSAGDRNGKVTGAITGNYTISLLDTSTGTFEIASSSNGSATANGTLQQAAKSTSYPDNSPSTVIVVIRNETATVTGTYGATYVNPGGILKGTGTIGDTYISGTIAPGMSPGCLHTGALTLNAGSTYAVELGGTTACTQYDQIAATGIVTLAGTLNTSLYNNFKPKAGQKFVIISNDDTDAVVGTFDGLAQGATFTVNGYTFSISYKGGDGNDVELTVTGTAPDTGFALIKNNPIVTLGVTLGGAAGILLISRRTKHATRR